VALDRFAARGSTRPGLESKNEIFESLLDRLFEPVTSAVGRIQIDTPARIALATRGNIRALCQRLPDNLPWAARPAGSSPPF